jgi:hypothetical protein
MTKNVSPRDLSSAPAQSKKRVGFTLSLIATGLVHELGLGTDVAAPGEQLGSLALHDQVAAVGTVVRARVALLVVDVELLKVSLVVRAQVLVMNLPAPKRNAK